MLSKDELAQLVADESDEYTISWKTPTSIFFGISPLALSPECAIDEKGSFATVKAYNPTEYRYQDEKLRIGKAFGVILRGGKIYGLTSQPYMLEKKAGEYSFQPPPAAGIKVKANTSTDIRPVFKDLATIMLENTQKKTKIKPLFDNTHLTQLKAVTYDIDNRVLRALNRAYHTIKGATEFAIVVRMYGGGRTRRAMTFKALHERHQISEVPEAWGNGISVYSKKTAKMLIGCETALDGKIFYFRLHQKDIPTYTEV